VRDKYFLSKTTSFLSLSTENLFSEGMQGNATRLLKDKVCYRFKLASKGEMFFHTGYRSRLNDGTHWNYGSRYLNSNALTV